MSQNPTSYSSKESDIASKNLWIGELEQWMDSNYLIEACHSFSKLFKLLKLLIIIYYRCSNKNRESNS
jgi:hypothetical protein